MAQRNVGKFYSKLGDFWSTEKYVDVTIKCEREYFKCHRLVLAAACEYFDAMFGGQFRERYSENISLPDISAQIFRQVLRFIYTGETPINSENVFPLLRASDFFKLTGIEDLCVQFVLANGVSLQDTLEMFMFACATKKEDLVHLLSIHMAKHFEMFSKLDGFLEIPLDDFRRIVVDTSQFLMRNEESLLNAITRWINHDRVGRLQYFHEFVKMIRFENISSTYIQFMFTKFFLDTHNHDVLTQTLKPVGYSEDFVLQQGVLSETKTSMYVLVEHPKEKFVKVYSLNSGSSCSVFDWVLEYNSSYWFRNIALDNCYVYSLRYPYAPHKPGDSLIEQTFRAYTSISNPSELRLKSPPVNFSQETTDLCAIKSNVYAYYPTVTNMVNQANRSTLFNDEELNHGICVYNCEVDDWFPAPRPNSAQNACITAQDDLLYLIGGSIPGYAQMYDSRSGKWQKLPETNGMYENGACCSMHGKIYVVGGLDYTEIERYDPKAGSWERMTGPYPLEKIMESPRLVPYSNRLYLMGGCLSDLSVYEFDFEAGIWDESSILIDKNNFGSGTIVDAVVFKS